MGTCGATSELFCFGAVVLVGVVLCARAYGTGTIDILYFHHGHTHRHPGSAAGVRAKDLVPRILRDGPTLGPYADRGPTDRRPDYVGARGRGVSGGRFDSARAIIKGE